MTIIEARPDTDRLRRGRVARSSNDDGAVAHMNQVQRDADAHKSVKRSPAAVGRSVGR